MKKLLIALIAGAFLSCGQSKKSGISVAADKYAVDSSSFDDPDYADTLISNFLKTQDLGVIGRNVSIGGIFESSALVIDPLKQDGVLFWYCKQGTGDNVSALFLAAEFSVNYPKASMIAGPGMVLVQPAKTIKYTAAGVEPNDVKNFLAALPKETALNNTAISTTTVSAFRQSFVSYCQGHAYNNYPYAFFDYKENAVMNTFMQPRPRAVRYFFGYEPRKKLSGSSPIRVILYRVETDGSTSSNPDPVQSSWPPPPWN